MRGTVPRLRIFAGPNGSGKSTMKALVESEIGPELLGVYINPDEIEAEIRCNGALNFSRYGVETTAEEILAFLRDSPLLFKAGLIDTVRLLTFEEGQLCFTAVQVNSYFASAISDFIRHKLLDCGITFTFETVMSSEDKVKFLRKAQERGYRTYLYYVATEDPVINISRVANRVADGGHPVPEDKIVDRYYRSLDLLIEAVQFSNRAYIFDNSSSENVCIAEVTEGTDLEFRSDAMPYWFKTALWDKFTS